MVQSCLHIVINYIRLPQTDQNMPYLTHMYRTRQNSAKT